MAFIFDVLILFSSTLASTSFVSIVVILVSIDTNVMSKFHYCHHRVVDVVIVVVVYIIIVFIEFISASILVIVVLNSTIIIFFIINAVVGVLCCKAAKISPFNVIQSQYSVTTIGGISLHNIKKLSDAVQNMPKALAILFSIVRQFNRTTQVFLRNSNDL